MNKYMQNFLKYKDLLKELVVRDIKIKYRRSALGILWSLLNPLLMMIVITIVFSQLFKYQIKNFPVYLLTGQIIFTFFSEATNMSMMSIISNASLIKKVYIPKYIFSMAKTLSSFVNLMFSLIAVVIVIIATHVKVSWVILLFPLPLICILLFAMGVGLILAAFSVFFRDLIHLYGVMLLVWNYLTPIFYPESIIPQRYHFVLMLNPLHHMIKFFREIILYARVPSLELMATCFGIAIFSLMLGLYVFFKKQDKFILYV